MTLANKLYKHFHCHSHVLDNAIVELNWHVTGDQALTHAMVF